MKKYLALAAAITVIQGVGCIKPTTTTTPTVSNVPPDVTGFAISAPSTYSVYSGVPVSITAPKLTNGTYTLVYTISGQYSYNSNSYSANITVENGKSSFMTPTLQYNGCQTLKTNSIMKTANLSSPVSVIANFCDSSGVMDAMYNNTKFYTTRASATLSGSTLQITGTVYDGSSYYSSGKTIQLTMQNFTQSPKTVNFTQADYYNRASYQSSTNSQTATYGRISVTATSPVLSGSFSFTTMDSSKFSGTFSVAAP